MDENSSPETYSMKVAEQYVSDAVYYVEDEDSYVVAKGVTADNFTDYYLCEGGINNWCKGVYQIYLKNTTSKEFYLSILLISFTSMWYNAHLATASSNK